LVVGLVGIANVLVIAVLEGRRDRGGEIGVRHAFGATRAAICAALGSAALVGGGSRRVEQDQAVDHLVRQAVMAELAGMGQALQSLGKAASERIRSGSPPNTTRVSAAVSGRTLTAGA
jgi:hypothetical protein